MNFEFRAGLRFGAAAIVFAAGLLFDIGWFTCPSAMLAIAFGFVVWSIEP